MIGTWDCCLWRLQSYCSNLFSHHGWFSLSTLLTKKSAEVSTTYFPPRSYQGHKELHECRLNWDPLQFKLPSIEFMSYPEQYFWYNFIMPVVTHSPLGYVTSFFLPLLSMECYIRFYLMQVAFYFHLYLLPSQSKQFFDFWVACVILITN